jgi:hypothetical protein
LKRVFEYCKSSVLAVKVGRTMGLANWQY